MERFARLLGPGAERRYETFSGKEEGTFKNAVERIAKELELSLTGGTT